MSVIYDVQTNKWREIHNTTKGLTGLSGFRKTRTDRNTHASAAH